MRKHIGIVAGSAIAGGGVLLAAAAFAGFDAGLPAVRLEGPDGLSWLLVSWALVLIGFVVALVACGIQAAAEEARLTRAALRAASEPEERLAPVIPLRAEPLAS